MTSTLVYLGCNKGNGVERLLKTYSFDRVLLVEADPLACSVLYERFRGISNISIINRCLVHAAGIDFVEFYRTGNSVSSSVLPPANSDLSAMFGGVVERVTLPAAFLPELLVKHKVDVVDFYVSDLQGYDFPVLQSVSRLLQEGRIKELFVETHKAENRVYEGADNGLDKFFDLLSNMYRLDYLSHDGKLLGTTDLVAQFLFGKDYQEADSHWSLRSNPGVLYRWV